jgi:hypothetical protein
LSVPKPDAALSFLRRPTIRLGGGATHQRGSLAGAQTVGLQERLDRLLVIDDGDRTRPVGAPQAAIDNVSERRIVGVDRLDQREPVWVSAPQIYRITGIM